MTGLLHGLSACRPRENAGLEEGWRRSVMRGAASTSLNLIQESEESEEPDRNPL